MTERWIQIPVADNVLPIVASCGHIMVDGMVEGEYAYVPAHVLGAEGFEYAREILSQYPVVEMEMQGGLNG